MRADQELELRLETAAHQFESAASDLRVFASRLGKRDKVRRAWIERIADKLSNQAQAMAAEMHDADPGSVGILARLGMRCALLFAGVATWIASSVATGALEHVGASVVDEIPFHSSELMESCEVLGRLAVFRELDDMLDFLGAKERFAIEARYGLIDGERHTQREIAEQLGSSTTTVRRLLSGAMEAIETEFGVLLEPYLEDEFERAAEAWASRTE